MFSGVDWADRGCESYQWLLMMSVMEYNNYGAAYNAAYQPYSSYSSYSSQPNHFNLKVGHQDLSLLWFCFIIYLWRHCARCRVSNLVVSEMCRIGSLCLMNLEFTPAQHGREISKKLLNFLWAGLIRSLAGIIKSLVSCGVDIWILVAVPPPHPTPPPPTPNIERSLQT